MRYFLILFSYVGSSSFSFIDIILMNICYRYLVDVYIPLLQGVLVQMTVNDLPVGRSVDETLRLIKAFQFVEKHGEGK